VMEETSVPPSREKVVVGVGACCIDLIGAVERFPLPDAKIRTTNFQVSLFSSSDHHPPLLVVCNANTWRQG